MSGSVPFLCPRLRLEGHVQIQTDIYRYKKNKGETLFQLYEVFGGRLSTWEQFHFC